MAKKKSKRRKQRLKLVDKQELIDERESLIKGMMVRTNKTLYENYKALKKIVEINEELEGKKLLCEVAEKLGCQDSYLRYLLRFGKLKSLDWLDKIPANVMLLTLNFNDDSERRQEEHFKYFSERKYNVDKARIHLVKEYIKLRDDQEEYIPHILYRRATSTIEHIKNIVKMLNASNMGKEERDLIKMHMDDLFKVVEDVFKDDEKEITNTDNT